jgi:hypothetical protein
MLPGSIPRERATTTRAVAGMLRHASRTVCWRLSGRDSEGSENPSVIGSFRATDSLPFPGSPRMFKKQLIVEPIVL